MDQETQPLASSKVATLTSLKNEKIFGIPKLAVYIAGGLIVLLIVLIVPIAVLSGATSAENIITPEDIENSINKENLKTTLSDLNDIAKLHSNSRSVSTGYNASAEYIEQRLAEFDIFNVTRQYFWAPTWEQNSDPKISLTFPYELEFTYGTDFGYFRYGGNGVSNVIDGNVSFVLNYGCQISDYPPDILGKIAVFKYGSSSTCSYYSRCLLAQNLGASAILMYNTGRGIPGASRIRLTYTNGFWNETQPFVQISVLGISNTVFEVLNSNQNSRVSVFTNQTIQTYRTYNVFAKTKNGDKNNKVLIGAHLDSVRAGPGINDDGTGSANILETALQIAKFSINLLLILKKRNEFIPQNQIQFCWWGAEEEGLIGSVYYTQNMPTEEKDQIKLYLNFDMNGSPNYILQIFNGSSAISQQGPATILQKSFENYFEGKKPFKLSGMGGGTDYYPFTQIGLPANGLATGAGAIKTIEEREKFGGLADTALDPCYHRFCDDLLNVDFDIFTLISKATAYVTTTLSITNDLNSFLNP